MGRPSRIPLPYFSILVVTNPSKTLVNSCTLIYGMLCFVAACVLPSLAIAFTTASQRSPLSTVVQDHHYLRLFFAATKTQPHIKQTTIDLLVFNSVPNVDYLHYPNPLWARSYVYFYFYIFLFICFSSIKFITMSTTPASSNIVSPSTSQIVFRLTNVFLLFGFKHSIDGLRFKLWKAIFTDLLIGAKV